MNWLFSLLNIARLASPELKATIRKMLDDLDTQAKTTKLPVDDIAVGILRTVCSLLGLV